MRLVKQIRDDKPLRESFLELAVRVFDLSFKDWYENGFWKDSYLPYSMVEEGKVVSNASVNVMDMEWKGSRKRCVQIGTVMTDPAYRNLGLSRRLLQEIIKDWKDSCDCLYLFANDTVLDFYPKFGFAREKEYQHILKAEACESDFVRLEMDRKEHRNLVKRCYEKGNPFSDFQMRENEGLLMFYCAGVLKDCVYYSPSLDCVCIAEKEGERIYLDDLFGAPGVSLGTAASRIVGTLQARESTVRLGFTPTEEAGAGCRFESVMEKEESDVTLFLLEGKENLLAGQKMMFPELSHA